MSVTLTPKGRTFVRAIATKAVIGPHDREGALDHARARWGDYEAVAVAKAAVAPATTESLGVDASKMEFHEQLREASIYGRLVGLRRVPFGVRAVRVTDGAAGYWVGEAAPKPISFAAVNGATLEPRKVTAIVVLTEESVRMGGAATEAALQRDIQRAVVDAWDEAFIAADNAGVEGERPPSITYGAPAIASSGNPAADIAALVDAFTGDFSAAFFVMHPATAAQLAMVRSGNAFGFPDAGPRGGSILGIPVITSRASPAGQIALVDPTGIAAADEVTEVDRAEHATLAMVDNPGQPPEAVALVNLWQNNMLAYKAEVYTNWNVQRTGSVVTVTGAQYEPA
jgi:HK97 family phage major capsid protein